MHEEFVNGTIAEVLEVFRARESVYGEITLVFAAARREAAAISDQTIRAEFESLRATGMRRNDAVKVIAEKYALRKNDVYRMLLVQG